MGDADPDQFERVLARRQKLPGWSFSAALGLERLGREALLALTVASPASIEL